MMDTKKTYPTKKRLTGFVGNWCFLLFLWVAFSGWYVHYISDFIYKDLVKYDLKVTKLESSIDQFSDGLSSLVFHLHANGVFSNATPTATNVSLLQADITDIQEVIRQIRLGLNDFNHSEELKGFVDQYSFDKDELTNVILNWSDGQVIEHSVWQAIFSKMEDDSLINQQFIRSLRALDTSIKRKYERDIETLQWTILSLLVITIALFSYFFFSFRKRFVNGMQGVHEVIRQYVGWNFEEKSVPYRAEEFHDLNVMLNHLRINCLLPAKEMAERYGQLDYAFLNSPTPSILVDSMHKVLLSNNAFDDLWEASQENIVKLLDLDTDEALIGARIDESHFVWLQESEQKVLLNGGVYRLVQSQIIKDGRPLGYVLRFEFISEMVELGVIHSSVKLMVQDVWDAPIRVLRNDSALAAISTSLEQIRVNVFHLISQLKLSGIRGIDSVRGVKEAVVRLRSLDGEQHSKTDFMKESDSLGLGRLDDEELKKETLEKINKITRVLVDQLESSVILGYENIVHRVALVHKDMQASVRALEESTRCLNDVRAITLKSLVMEEKVEAPSKQSLAKDINHDIDTVITLLSDLVMDERKTIELLTAEIEVAELRKQKASLAVRDLESVMSASVSAVFSEKATQLMLEHHLSETSDTETLRAERNDDHWEDY